MMNKFLLVISILVLSFSQLAQAELSVGLVDMRAALFSSDAAKTFTENMVSKYKQQDMEVRAVGEEGQKLEMRLKNDAAIMSDNERSKLASELEAKIQEYKYLKSKLDNALAEKRQEFLSDSKPKVDQAIKELVKEEKLDLLMPREAALYANESMDLTEKFIEKLNKLNK
ncbi:MAG: OmpH family outer membrane protein [Oleiphilus sp.]